jgi:hypothetical protein
VIWVWGSALVVPGLGYTLTGAGWATAPVAATSNTNAVTRVTANALLTPALSCRGTSCNL